jgi:hypothetical protein
MFGNKVLEKIFIHKINEVNEDLGHRIIKNLMILYRKLKGAS